MTEALSEIDCQQSHAESRKNSQKAKTASRSNHIKHILRVVKYPQDENNNSEDFYGGRALKAVQFKYVSNASLVEIGDIRKLLAFQRAEQLRSEDEWNFFKSDFDRMMVDDWLVTRFLLRGKKANSMQSELNCRQSQHTSPNCRSFLTKTMELIDTCARFRYKYRISALTQESEFPSCWTSINGMFAHGHDRVGNPVAYLRVSLHKPKLIETDELRHEFYRYMLYVLEQCDQDLFQKPGRAICCVFDMSNIAFENIDLELTTWMIKSFKSCAPKLLCYVILYNPPWFFMATFRLICNTLLSDNKRRSFRLAYGDEILDYIDHNNLPYYLQERLVDIRT